MDINKRVAELTTQLSETNYDSEDEHLTNGAFLYVTNNVIMVNFRLSTSAYVYLNYCGF